MPGVPGIYYHSILGSRNDTQAAIDSGINRRINRAKVDFKKLIYELENSKNLQSNIFTLYSQMLKIRRQESLFNPYGQADYWNEDGAFIIERKDGNTTLICVHNFSSKEIEIAPISDEVEVLFGNPIECNAWVLGAFEFQWLKI